MKKSDLDNLKDIVKDNPATFITPILFITLTVIISNSLLTSIVFFLFVAFNVWVGTLLDNGGFKKLVDWSKSWVQKIKK